MTIARAVNIARGSLWAGSRMPPADDRPACRHGWCRRRRRCTAAISSRGSRTALGRRALTLLFGRIAYAAATAV